MASTKRGLGTASTEASEKNTSCKPDGTQASRRTQQKNPRADSRAGRRDYSIYSGQKLLGRIVVNKATNQAVAWTAAGFLLGRFEGYQAAAEAIDRDARQTADALRRLADPNPPFASGLPEHFLRRG